VLEVPVDMDMEEVKGLLMSIKPDLTGAQRWWLCGIRRNGTFRVVGCCDSNEEHGFQTLCKKWKTDTLTFFVEELAVDDAGEPVCDPIVAKNEHLVFVKFYDRQEHTLRVLGHKLVKDTDRVSVLAPLVEEATGVSASNLTYFEEFRPNSIDPLNGNSTFADAQLSDGDIVLVQVTGEEESSVVRHCSEMRDTIHLTLVPMSSREDTSSFTELTVSRAITLPELGQSVLSELGRASSSSIELFVEEDLDDRSAPFKVRQLESLSDFADFFHAGVLNSTRGRHAVMYYTLDEAR